MRLQAFSCFVWHNKQDKKVNDGWQIQRIVRWSPMRDDQNLYGRRCLVVCCWCVDADAGLRWFRIIVDCADHHHYADNTRQSKRPSLIFWRRWRSFDCKSYVNRLERSCQGSIGGARCSLSNLIIAWCGWRRQRVLFSLVLWRVKKVGFKIEALCHMVFEKVMK